MLRLARLADKDPPVESGSASRQGRQAASRKLRPGFQIDEFWWPVPCPYYMNDVVIQIVDESKGAMVSPPGRVLYLKKWRGRKRRLVFVYLEVPKRRRVGLKSLAKRLGRGSQAKLSRNGRVTDPEFALKLLNAWGR